MHSNMFYFNFSALHYSGAGYKEGGKNKETKEHPHHLLAVGALVQCEFSLPINKQFMRLVVRM